MTQQIIAPIKANSVFLRMLELTDTEKIYKMSVETSMREWIPDQVYKDQDHAQNVLTFLLKQYSPSANPEESPLILGVCLSETNELIGHIGLSPIKDMVEVGYAIEESQQRQGYAFEAVSAMCDWAFFRFHFRSIMGIVAKANIASCKTLAKVGFVMTEEKEQVLHNKRTMVKVFQMDRTLV